MSRPAKPFADKLDEFLETATEQEVRDVAVSVATYARWKKLDFRVEVKQAKTEKPLPLLDGAHEPTPKE
jgi:hypothetical protein